MRKRSIMLIISTVLATLYTGYIFYYFINGTVSATDSVEQLGGAIATTLVMPHAIMFLIGIIFAWIGIIIKKEWAALVAAILYSVGTLFFLIYAMFGVPILILGFIGFANQKKLNDKNKDFENATANTIKTN